MYFDPVCSLTSGVLTSADPGNSKPDVLGLAPTTDLERWIFYLRNIITRQLVNKLGLPSLQPHRSPTSRVSCLQTHVQVQRWLITSEGCSLCRCPDKLQAPITQQMVQSVASWRTYPVNRHPASIALSLRLSSLEQIGDSTNAVLQTLNLANSCFLYANGRILTKYIRLCVYKLVKMALARVTYYQVLSDVLSNFPEVLSGPLINSKY